MESPVTTDAVLHLTGPLLVGTDDVRTEAWVVDGTITFEPPAPGRPVSTVAGWVVPGLVDMHCHIGLGPGGEMPRDVAREHALTDRDAGTLLVRDTGQPGDTRWMDDDPELPRIVRAGRHIARTRRYLRNFGHEIEPELLVQYVRQEARRSDGWVKLVGDWIDRSTGDLMPCWPAEALPAAIAAAHEEGARVTAHTFGEEAARDLLAAGIDCLEHATGLTDDTLGEAAARGVAIVPTLTQTRNFAEFAAAGRAKFPAYAARMERLDARRHTVLREAHAAGLRIFAGTDAGGTIKHGLLPEELQLMVDAGLPAADVVAAATWGAREFLRRPGLTEGAPADLVVLDADPRTDVSTFARPLHVVLRGRRVAGR